MVPSQRTVLFTDQSVCTSAPETDRSEHSQLSDLVTSEFSRLHNETEFNLSKDGIGNSAFRRSSREAGQGLSPLLLPGSICQASDASW